MVIIKENIKKAMEMLENCIKKETIVCIHGKVNEFIVRYSSAVDEFNINQNELCLVCGWFEMNIKENITEISYNEDRHGIHIVFTNGELYLDFDKNNNNLE